MATTIAQIMLGIETRLATISGLRVAEYIPSQVNPPQAYTEVPVIPEYHRTMRMGKFSIDPTVVVLVSRADTRSGQLKLADYANPAGATSIRAAIEADQTLGGVADSCIVVDFRPLGFEEVGVIGYYGGRFTLRAVASGA